MLVTPFYAAVMALFFVYLSIRTIRIRRSAKIAIGGGDNPLLQRAIRVHGNFAEYVPVAVLLIYFLEINTGLSFLVHILFLALIAGRAIHFYGVREVDETIKFRVIGMATTFTVIILSSLGLLLSYIFPVY